MTAYPEQVHRNRPRRKELAVLFADVPWFAHVLNAVVLIMGVLLIGLVLIQRGKGGGLAGAFGGVGGSSAFGSRAGDLFTRITLGFAAAWIALIMVQVWVVQATNTGATGPVGLQQTLGE
jgi:preprotein translocase subunit SecG